MLTFFLLFFLSIFRGASYLWDVECEREGLVKQTTVRSQRLAQRGGGPRGFPQFAQTSLPTRRTAMFARVGRGGTSRGAARAAAPSPRYGERAPATQALQHDPLTRGQEVLNFGSASNSLWGERAKPNDPSLSGRPALLLRLLRLHADKKRLTSRAEPPLLLRSLRS